MDKLVKFAKSNLPLLLILAASLIIRINNFDYPLLNGETHRDYLVGRHILNFAEFPQTGPCCLWNGALGEIRNSPVYYYTTAVILGIKDNVLFLSAINILLQLGTIFTTYFLANRFFGKTTALIATILFSASTEVLRQSQFFWQPHLMNAFVNFSYLFLALSYLKKSYFLALVSIFLFLFGGSIHNAAFGLLPIFYFAIFGVLKNQKSPAHHYFFVIVFSILTLTLFYLPWFINLAKDGSFLKFSPFQRFLVAQPSEFAKNFSLVTTTLIKTFWQNPSFLGSISGLVVLACFFVYFANFKRNVLEKRVFFLILFFAIIQFLLISALFRAKIWSFYFTPIFSLFVILIAEVINSVLSKNLIAKTAKLLLIFILIKIFSSNFNFLSFTPLVNLKHVNEATAAIENKIFETQKREKLPDLNFFQIKVYSTGVESPATSELVFWSKLEKDLNSKFIKVVDSANSFNFLNGNNYLFLICQSTPRRINEEKECLAPFSQEFKNHSIVGKIFSQQPFSIYLTTYKDNPNRMKGTI